MLLIDEIDRVEVEAEALMLEVLSDFQVTIPELGTMHGDAPADGLPDLERHARPVRGAQAPVPLPPHRLPDDRARAGDPAGPRGRPDAGPRGPGRVGSSPRSATWTSRSAPSISESLDWARTLVLLGIEGIRPEDVGETLHVLLKYEADIERARRRLAGLPVEGDEPAPHVDAFRAPEGTPG